MLMTAAVECGKYFKAERGTLTLDYGQLRFETGGHLLFDVQISSIQKIVWPWYSFGGAFEATIAGQRYSLSFVPRGASLDRWYTGLSVGRRWRAALEGRPAPERAPIAAGLFLVLFRIARIFILGCMALLLLGVTIDPTASTLNRILGAVGAAAVGLLTLVLTGQGIMAIGAALRGKK